MRPHRTSTANRWLWVTQPEYYLEADGSDRRCLEPSDHASPWWTCDKGTQEGDLILLYRTAPRKDIAYLIEAGTDAYETDTAEVGIKNWTYRCDYRVVNKFGSPLPLRVLRDDPILCDWWPLRRNFQGIVFPVDDSYWQRLIELLAARNPKTFYASKAL